METFHSTPEPTEKDIAELTGTSDIATPEEMLAALLQTPLEEPETLAAEIKALGRVEGHLLKTAVHALEKHMLRGTAGFSDSGDEHLAGREDYVAAAHDLAEHANRLIVSTLKAMSAQGHDLSRMPYGLQQQLEALTRPPTVPWRTYFRQFVLNAKHSWSVPSYTSVSNNKAALMKFFRHTKLARRLVLFPGIERDVTFTIAFIRDTSGSMYDYDLRAADSELRHIQKSAPGISITYIDADDDVREVQELDYNTQIRSSATGRGGTSFDPALRYISDQIRKGKRYDLIVYVTDGICYPPTVRLPIPSIWLITPGRASRKVTDEAGNLTLFMRPYAQGERVG